MSEIALPWCAPASIHHHEPHSSVGRQAPPRSRLYGFDHVRPFQVVAQLPVVMPGSNAADDSQLGAAVLIPGNALCSLHEERPESLMLELVLIARRHSHRRSVHMQLPDDGAAALQFRLPVGHAAGAFAQPDKPDEDILLRVLVCQERLPPAIG